MDRTVLGELASASGHELRAEEQRLLAQTLALVDQGLALQEEAERFLRGPEADRERYMELHADYLHLHKLQMQMHGDFMHIHKELQRRGH